MTVRTLAERVPLGREAGFAPKGHPLSQRTY